MIEIGKPVGKCLEIARQLGPIVKYADDPANGDRAVVEYTSLDMWRTSNSGYSPKGTIQAFTEMTPSCGALTYTPPNCDPTARFIAPFEADPKNVDHWVAGGRYLWDNGGKGWSTSCSATACDWTRLDDSGSGHAITAIGINGSTVYTGWCGTAPLCYGNQAAPNRVADYSHSVGSVERAEPGEAVDFRLGRLAT